MPRELLSFTDIYYDITNDFFKDEREYNTTKMLQNETVEAMIYALSNSDNIEIATLPSDVTKKGFTEYATTYLAGSLAEGKTLLLPITGKDHHAMVAVKRFGDTYHIIHANSIPDNKICQGALGVIKDWLIAQVGKENVKGLDISADIQHGNCCGLSVAHNSLNVIKSSTAEELTKLAKGSAIEIQEDKERFYQKFAKETYKKLLAQPEIKAIRQEQDRLLAFQLQSEEINHIINGPLAKAIKGNDVSAAADLMVQIGTMIGHYEYQNFAGDIIKMNDKLKGGLVEGIKEVFSAEFKVDASLPKELTELKAMQEETVNKWQNMLKKAESKPEISRVL